MSISNQENNVFFKNKQRGAAMTDQALALGVVVLSILVVLALWSPIQFAYRKIVTTMHVGEIVKQANEWKKLKPTFDNLTIGTLCAESYLNETICGPAGNAVGTNPFGGNYTVGPNANPGLLNVSMTMPQDGTRVTDIADSLASGTRSRCTSRNGCATLNVAGTTITGTY